MLYIFPLHKRCKYFVNILYKISLLIVSLVLVVGMEAIKSYGEAFRPKERTRLL